MNVNSTRKIKIKKYIDSGLNKQNLKILDIGEIKHLLFIFNIINSFLILKNLTNLYNLCWFKHSLFPKKFNVRLEWALRSRNRPILSNIILSLMTLPLMRFCGTLLNTQQLCINHS